MVQTLHPESMAALYRWIADEDKVSSFASLRGPDGRAPERFLNSPFKVVFDTSMSLLMLWQIGLQQRVVVPLASLIVPVR